MRTSRSPLTICKSVSTFIVKYVNGVFAESHYLKHHPFYEFKNFDDLQVDGYQNWLHGRADYFQSETYPGELSAWEMGSKFNHMIYLTFPIFAFYFFGNQYKKQCRLKGLSQPIVGVFSQHPV